VDEKSDDSFRDRFADESARQKITFGVSTHVENGNKEAARTFECGSKHVNVPWDEEEMIVVYPDEISWTVDVGNPPCKCCVG